jgi:hypothetical protein
MMDIGFYRQYLAKLVKEALENSNGTPASVIEYLETKKISGLFVRHRKEKEKALKEVMRAFDEHRHWPMDIIISHLGIENHELE